MRRIFTITTQLEFVDVGGQLDIRFECPWCKEIVGAKQPHATEAIGLALIDFQNHCKVKHNMVLPIIL